MPVELFLADMKQFNPKLKGSSVFSRACFIGLAFTKLLGLKKFSALVLIVWVILLVCFSWFFVFLCLFLAGFGISVTFPCYFPSCSLSVITLSGTHTPGFLKFILSSST